MEILQLVLNFFNIEMLTADATVLELVVYLIQILIAIWLVAFVVRSLFLLLSKY